MSQKVKIQFQTEIADIPKFCSLNLSDVEICLEEAYETICSVRSDLRKANLEDVKVNLAKIEKIRTLMGKTDDTLADIFGILMGFVELSEKTVQQTQDKKELL